jgi:DNA-binding transcriptional ArsR family regulator
MNESLNEMEKVFMAFADTTRLRLLYLMRNGEVSVNYLCEALQTSQPKVSRHLAYLRSMGIVHTRRDGKWIFYSLSLPESRIGSQLFRDMLMWVGSSSEIGDTTATQNNCPTREQQSNRAHDTYVDTHIFQPREELEIHLL